MTSCYTHSSMAVELIMLFVDGQPLVYEVEKKRTRYFFTPLTSWKDTLEAASFTLEKVKGQWEAIGIQDKNLIDQAIEEVEKRSF
jgi:hypothetical protein